MNQEAMTVDQTVRQWVKRFKKQKDGHYRERFPYIILKQVLDELKRRPQDFYLQEGRWFDFCKATGVAGLQWLRQMVTTDRELMALILPHLKSNDEQLVLERVGLPVKDSSDRDRLISSAIQSLSKPLLLRPLPSGAARSETSDISQEQGETIEAVV